MIMSGISFSGKLIRAVVVGAARHDHFLPEGSVASQRDQIGTGFACGIGRTGIQRRLLGKFPGRAERAINFIGRDLNETLDAMPPRAIEQHARPDHIGMNEILRRINAAIDMRFGGEIDDRVKRMLRHERIHLVGICNIGFEKFVTLAMFLRDAVQIGEIPGVGEDIDVADRGRLVMLQNISNKVAPDESTATGNQYAHRCALLAAERRAR